MAPTSHRCLAAPPPQGLLATCLWASLPCVLDSFSIKRREKQPMHMYVGRVCVSRGGWNKGPHMGLKTTEIRVSQGHAVSEGAGGGGPAHLLQRPGFLVPWACGALQPLLLSSQASLFVFPVFHLL